MRRSIKIAALAAVGTLALTACGGGGGGGGDGDLEARGDITIWYSNNEAEIEWGKQMVEAWNADHPDEQVKAQEIPAGDSSEAVDQRRDHGRQRSLPDLQHLAGGRPAVREGRAGSCRLSSFEDGDDYITERSGDNRGAVRVGRRRVLPDAVEVEPGRHLLQQGHVHRSGPRPRGPALSTYDEFLDTVAHADAVRRGSVRHLPGARRASSSSPGSTSIRSTAPRPAARCSSRTARRPSIPRAGAAVVGVLGDDVRGRPCRPGGVQRRLLRRRQLRHDDRRTLGDRLLRRRRRLGDRAGARHRPGTPADETYTFSDAKNVGLFSACESKGTAWDVLKFATSEEQDGQLLELTGQMPLRQDLTASLPGLLRGEPRVRGVRRPGGPRRRGAERRELDRDVADLPRRATPRPSSSARATSTSFLTDTAAEVDALVGQG